MAEKKTIELEIKSNLDSAERSVGSLKSQLRQAQAEVAALSDKFGATSREAVGAAQKAAVLADKIQDAKALTDAFNPDAKFRALSGSLNGIAGGFSVVTGVMGTLGTESKEVESAILKVQSAMAIASGAQSLGESIDSFKQLGAVIKSTTVFQQISTAAQKLWNLAMSANPIGAVVLAITTLIAAGTALISWYKSSSDEAKKNSQAVKSNSQALESQKRTADKTADSIKKNSDYQLEMAKASGASSEAIRKLELKLIDEKIAYANSSREVAKNTYHKNLNTLASLEAAGAEEDVIAAQAETTKKSLEEFGKQTKNLNDANSEKIQIIRKHNVEKKQAETNHNKEVTDANKKATDEGKQKAIEQAKEDLDNLNNALKAQKDSQISAENELTQAISEAQDKQSEFLLTAQQVEERNINDKYFRLLEMAKQQNRSKEEIDALEIAQLNELNDVKLKADEKLNADKKAIRDKDIADIKAAEEAKRNINATAIQSAQQLVGILAGLGEKNKKLQKAALIANGALSIAEIINNTNVGSAKEVATKGIFGLSTSAVLYAKMAISIGSVIAATAKGLSALGGGGSVSSGGSSTPASAPAAPAFNVVGASSTNQLAQTIGNQQQQPIKAYVVANDVTTQQSLDRNIVQSASIG